MHKTRSIDPTLHMTLQVRKVVSDRRTSDRVGGLSLFTVHFYVTGCLSVEVPPHCPQTETKTGIANDRLPGKLWMQIHVFDIIKGNLRNTSFLSHRYVADFKVFVLQILIKNTHAYECLKYAE